MKKSIWVVCLVYALHIALVDPKLEFDAQNFWTHAQQFLSDGLFTTLAHTAPPREPGYPLFIYAVAKLVPSAWLLKAVISFQMLLLLLCGMMMASLTKLIRPSSWLSLAVFLAVSLSPALLSTAQTLYSESLAAFLFTSWIFFLVRWHREWRETSTSSLSLIISGIAGTFLIMTRGAYLHVLLASFLGLMAMEWFFTAHDKRVKLLKLMALYGVILFTLPAYWMHRNQRVFGVSTMADHAGVVLKGRYERSLETYTRKDFFAGTLNSISESACRAVYKDCTKYAFEHANTYGYVAATSLANERGISGIQANQIVFKETLHAVFFKHPIRFFAFSWFELWQLVFFETMGTGATSVDSAWLRSLQGLPWLRGGIHLGLSTFYLLGIGLFLFFFLRRSSSLMNDVSDPALFWMMGIPLAGHFAVYSMATTVIRYSFVIAPIYILLALVGWSALTNRLRSL